MSYSIDFKSIVVKKFEAGMSYSSISTFFKINRATVVKWVKEFQQYGCFPSRQPRNRKPKKIAPDMLRAAIERRPDATLSELAEEFNCWPQSIHKRCVALGITRKKNYAVRRKK